MQRLRTRYLGTHLNTRTVELIKLSKFMTDLLLDIGFRVISKVWSRTIFRSSLYMPKLALLCQLSLLKIPTNAGFVNKPSGVHNNQNYTS
jgi:hypothetical protein